MKATGSRDFVGGGDECDVRSATISTGLRRRAAVRGCRPQPSETRDELEGARPRFGHEQQGPRRQQRGSMPLDLLALLGKVEPAKGLEPPTC